MATEAEAPKRVPKRNDQKQAAVMYRNSSRGLRGANPDFHYEYLSPDEDSPGFYENKLVEHEFGTPNGWNTMIPAWQVVNAQTDPKVVAVEDRTDQGKPVDSRKKRGRQILCRIPKDEYDKYRQVEEANQKDREKQLFSPDRRGDSKASMGAVVMHGDRDSGERMQALTNAGNPL